MIEPVLELPLDLQTKKTFLREIKLNSFRATQSIVGAERNGFWSKVLNKQPSFRHREVPHSSGLRLELGGWVNLPPGFQSAVSLLLEYEDDSGQHCFIIDEMNARGASQVLLAGSVDLKLKGPVKSMQVFCGGIADRSVWIDSMHLKTSEIESQDLRQVG